MGICCCSIFSNDSVNMSYLTTTYACLQLYTGLYYIRIGPYIYVYTVAVKMFKNEGAYPLSFSQPISGETDWDSCRTTN